MIIIKSKTKNDLEKEAAKRFPLSPNIDIQNLDTSGLLMDTDIDDPKERAKVMKTHPFMRPSRSNMRSPNYIRWMWHPRGGEMLVDSTGYQDHSAMSANYNRKLKEKQIPEKRFEEWLRGYYWPDSGKLATRPYNELEQTSLPFQVRPNERESDFGAQAFNLDMQQHVRGLLEKGLGKKFTKDTFHPNISNQWLMDNFGGRRW